MLRDKLFDLIFVDGNKEHYKEYVVKTEELLPPAGIMVVDDCFFHGDVANSQAHDPKGMDTRADGLCGRQERLAPGTLPVSNGIFLIARADCR